MVKKAEKSEFLAIPGVGPSIAEDLRKLGFRKVADLKKANPEEMYEALCKLQGQRIDRCLLYVFRCAVKYSKMTDKKREDLKWWDFKDKK